MTGKEHKCAACKKDFATAKALAQHKKAVHGGGAQKSAAKVKDAPVARGVREGSTRATSGAREAGRDRFAHFEDVSKFTSGQTLLSVVFTPHRLPRCKELAKVYQRYDVHKIRFHIVPMLSTATSGGYIAAFIRDPEDVVSGADAANVVTSTQGSVTKKWWEEAMVSCPASRDHYYTATEPGQERFSSPGVLVVAVDGKATQQGSVTIYCEYDLSFYAPGLESQKDSGTVQVLTNLRMAAGNDYIETAAGDRKASAMFSGTLVDNTILEAPHPIYYLINTSGSVTGMASFKYILIKTDSVQPCGAEGTVYSEKTFGNATVLFAGEQMLIRKKPENRQVGFEYLCFRANSEPSSQKIERSGDRLEMSTERLEEPSIQEGINEMFGDFSTLSREVLEKIVLSAQESLSSLKE